MPPADPGDRGARPVTHGGADRSPGGKNAAHTPPAPTGEPVAIANPASSWFRWDGDALILSLRIQPGARQTRIDGPYGERLKVRIAAPPVDGKANQQLVKFFARLCGVGKSHISLLSGATGRNKLIRIEQPRQLPDGIDRPTRG